MLADLNADPGTAPIPVIVVSTLVETLPPERALLASAVIGKPFDVPELLAALRATRGKPASARPRWGGRCAHLRAVTPPPAVRLTSAHTPVSCPGTGRGPAPPAPVLAPSAARPYGVESALMRALAAFVSGAASTFAVVFALLYAVAFVGRAPWERPPAAEVLGVTSRGVATPVPTTAPPTASPTATVVPTPTSVPTPVPTAAASVPQDEGS